MYFLLTANFCMFPYLSYSDFTIMIKDLHFVFLLLIGEVRSIIVAFDDPETGLEQFKLHKHDRQINIYEKDKGVPIFRSNQTYEIPHRKSFKTHSAKCQIKQFPLKLSYASTGHKVQGITIKKGQNVVVHGHEKIPHGMYYLMLSRAQELEQIYIEMPLKKNKQTGKSEKIDFVIKANPHSLQENENLVQRSIIPDFKSKRYCVFMVNVASIKNKMIDLTNDVYAQASDHICVVETWLNSNQEYSLNIPGRYGCC